MRVLALLSGLVLASCTGRAVPDPRSAAEEYAQAAARGDGDAIYEMMTTSAQKARSREDVKRLVSEQRGELSEQAKSLTAKDARVEAVARLRYEDGEEAQLELRDGRFWITSCALPGGSRTPEQALDQLRRVLARRSYAGLMRVLTPSTRAAVEQDLRSLVSGLERPETLHVDVAGDGAVVTIPGGHSVKLKREGGVWRVDDSTEKLTSPRANVMTMQSKGPRARLRGHTFGFANVWSRGGVWGKAPSRKTLALVPFVLAAIVLSVLLPRPARAFGDVGAFDPRALLAGGTTGPARATAAGRWSWELVQRTSAPARLKATQIRADDGGVVDGPFLWWSGDAALLPLSPQEIAGLRRFFALGGILLVDDAGVSDDGSPSAFSRTARDQIARVLPDSTPIALGADHVLFKSYYLLKRAEGRVAGPRTLDAIVRGGQTQVVFSSHDLGGALARGATGAWEQPVVPGGDVQRERAIRLAVNIAMYVLCSNYKDDQVHAPFLMRRRAGALMP